MSYNTIAVMADDPFLIGRLTACAAEEEKPKPYQAWVQEHRWDFVATPGWIEAWESAEAAGTADIGANPDVITDVMILAAVGEDVDPPIDPPIDPPVTSDNVWTSGATLTTKTDDDGTVWQVGTRTTTAAVRLLSLITGLELQPSSWYRFVATARQPSAFPLSTLAFRPDVSTSTDGVDIAKSITIPAGESTLDFTFKTPAAAMTDNAGIAFVSSKGVVGDYLEVRDDATVEPAEEPPVPPPSGNVWLEDDFSTAPKGTMTSSYLTTNWATATIGSGLSRASVVDDNGIPRLRIALPEGVVGAGDTGSTWRCTFPGTLEATAEYWIRFDSGFDWTKGGKIPGLCGGTSPTGGDPDPNGFSARYMWNDGGKLILYLYWAEMEGTYGNAFQLGYLNKGQGYVLKQRIKMNTPGQANGEIQIWVDGVEKMFRKDFKFRLSGASWDITSFYWSVFHGGNNADYEPNRDNWIDFDRVLVTRA